MAPRFFSIPVFALLLLAGCMKAQDTTSQALDTAGTETSASYDKMRDYLDLGHKPKPKPAPNNVQPRYCYKTYQDVICYSKPLAGEEYRLVGFQTSSGKTGYTMDSQAVPGGAMDAPLPPIKVVTVTTPPTVKAVDSNSSSNSNLKEIIFDPAELEPKELVPEKPQ